MKTIIEYLINKTTKEKIKKDRHERSDSYTEITPKEDINLEDNPNEIEKEIIEQIESYVYNFDEPEEGTNWNDFEINIIYPNGEGLCIEGSFKYYYHYIHATYDYPSDSEYEVYEAECTCIDIYDKEGDELDNLLFTTQTEYNNYLKKINNYFRNKKF